MEVTLRSLSDTGSSIKLGVLGGANAQIKEFPYQVALTYDDSYYCGGSIIGTIFVLTAAHCVFNLVPSKFSVIAGDHNRLLVEGSEQVRQASRIFVHEEYKRATLDNDIAIIVLSQPFQFNANVQPIKFLRDNARHSGSATVSGWGQLKHGDPSHPILQKADVNIVSSNECRKSFNDNNLKFAISDDVICAGGVGKDACRGDSGGPLSAYHQSEKVLAGIVSWGVPCNETSVLPGVYVKVAKYSGWIEETMMRYGRESGICRSEEFYCIQDNVCIFSHWVCDGDNDCSNGEDEGPTLCSVPCPHHQFQCNGGKCINADWLCDGRPDCSEGEDETNCDSCKQGSIRCSNEGKCYSKTSRCDGNHDCSNGEDESNCTSCHGRGSHCKKDQKCIPWTWRCDGEKDCSDGQDEKKCLCLFGVCMNRLF